MRRKRLIMLAVVAAAGFVLTVLVLMLTGSCSLSTPPNVIVAPPSSKDAGRAIDAGSTSSSDAGDECSSSCALRTCPDWFGDGGSCLDGCRALESSGISIDFVCLRAAASCTAGHACFQ